MIRKSLVFLLTAIALVGCKGNNSEAASEQAQKVAVKVAEARGGIVPQNVEFTANIEPWQKVNIVPALQGARIARIYVKVGDRVTKGQLVAQMDPTQYNTARVQFETAEADYQRTKKVYEVGGVSAQMMQSAEAQYLVAKEAMENLKSHVNLYSPINGVVTQKGEDEGNLFTQTPILEIMQIDRLKVRVDVSEQYFSSVSVGTPVEVSVDILPDETFPATVSLVYPSIDPATRTFGAEVTIPNNDSRLRPGMFARTTIHMGDREGVMIPDLAVQKQTGTNERYVYVIDGGVAHRRVVTVGRIIGSQMDILSGLEAGESVAITSFARLSEGVKITIND